MEVCGPSGHVDPSEKGLKRNALHASYLEEGVGVNLHVDGVQRGFMLGHLRLPLQQPPHSLALLPLYVSLALNALEPHDLSAQSANPLDTQGDEQTEDRPHN